MKPKKFYLPAYDSMSVAMLKKHGHSVVDVSDDWDCALFTGGADVCPLLYGELPIPGTGCNLARDRLEVKFFKDTHPLKPKVGICRGGQFLNVMAGGSMWQNVTGHAGADHLIRVLDVGDILCTSTHHQMMIPSALGLIVGTANECDAWDAEKLSVRKPLADDWSDVEIVYYEGCNSLCFQPHPEYKEGDMRDLFFELIKESVFR